MPQPVELRLATSNSSPTGTGSFSYRGEFEVVVQNLAFEKRVAIHGQQSSGQPFVDESATYQRNLADGRELWKLTTGDQLLDFVVRYDVQGNTFWDNNGGADYRQPPVFDDFDALLGRVPNVVFAQGGFSDSTHVRILAAVKNLAFAKQVGIVYTTDAWTTAAVANGAFSHTLASGNEVWATTAFVGAAKRVELAVFYRVAGQEFWDNNFSANHLLTR